MSQALVIHVRFHDGRYHGSGDWPPSPARLFQALVAAAGLGGKLEHSRQALAWLESLPPPLIAAPHGRRGQRVVYYMPNNDLDAIQGDLRRVAKIRLARKYSTPWLFDATVPLVYVWQDVVEAEEGQAATIISLADHVYQLGRGIDMAWAWGDRVGTSHVETLLESHGGAVYRPSQGGEGALLRCPRPGSLQSVARRYEAYRKRFKVQRKGRRIEITFYQPPRASFRSVAYESPAWVRVFELRPSLGDSSFAPWPLASASKLVVCLRDAAVERLRAALTGREAEIARVLIGRKPDGTNDGPASERVAIVPLPSIGHPHADRAIRRVLIRVPAGCSLRTDDVSWAFSGLKPIDVQTGEEYPIVVTPAGSLDMLRHYGTGEEARAYTWRTVTPAALPSSGSRRRIDPARKTTEAKSGEEKRQELARAAGAVIQALRHAGVRVPVQAVQVQREPFEGNGERAEAFSRGTRFPHQRLWHVQISFSEPVSGPLVIGDGRFLGLGVMAPLPHRSRMSGNDRAS